MASVTPDSPASRFPEIVGKEVIAIGDFRLGKGDLFEEFGRIHDYDSFKHFWKAQEYFDGHVKVGVPLSITINSGAGFQPVETGKMPVPPVIQITPSSFPLYQVISRVFSNFSVSIAALLMGLVVTLKRPDDKKAFLYLLFSLFGSLVVLSAEGVAFRDLAFDIRAFHFLGVVNLFAVTFGSGVFLRFCLIFPAEKKMFRNFLTALYALAAGIFLSSLFSSLFYLYAEAFSLLCVTGGLEAMIHSYTTVNSADKKAQAKWFIYGAGLFFVMYMAVIVRGFLYGPNDTIEHLIGFAYILIPLSMSFAILKYRLMDIDTLFDNTLIYSVTLGLLILLDMAVITALIKTGVLDFPGSNPFVAISVLVWTVIFVYLPVRNFVQHRIKRLLKREVYDANQAALELSREMLSATDVVAALEKTIDAIKKTLHPKGGESFLHNKNLPSPLFAKEGNKSSPFEKGGLRRICEDITDPAHLFSFIPSEELPKDWSGGVFVPLIGSTGRLGYIVLQDKHSERLYDREDMKLLGIMASQAAMSIEAIRHREEAERKEKEAKAEKERITRDIHDGISRSFPGSWRTARE